MTGGVRAALLAAGLTRAYLALLLRRPPGGAQKWEQENYAGRTVSRIGGAAYTLGVLSSVPLIGGPPRLRAATVVAVGSAAAVGLYDDMAGDATARGLRGHAKALMAGQLTTGAIKVVVMSASSLAAATLVRRRWRDVVVAAPLIAGSANLANLLDLRPGRALKVAAAFGTVSSDARTQPSTAAVLGAAAAMLPDDLGERVMLGDCGAGALGAGLGVGLAAAASPRRLRALLAFVVALNVASEFVSFTRLIDSVPPLRALDRLGRQS